MSLGLPSEIKRQDDRFSMPPGSSYPSKPLLAPVSEKADYQVSEAPPSVDSSVAVPQSAILLAKRMGFSKSALSHFGESDSGRNLVKPFEIAISAALGWRTGRLMPFSAAIQHDAFGELFGVLICGSGENRARLLMGEGMCPAAQASFDVPLLTDGANLTAQVLLCPGDNEVYATILSFPKGTSASAKTVFTVGMAESQASIAIGKASDQDAQTTIAMLAGIEELQTQVIEWLTEATDLDMQEIIEEAQDLGKALTKATRLSTSSTDSATPEPMGGSTDGF